jgi:hypothetical protein
MLMKNELKVLVIKLSKDINVPPYSVFNGIRKAVRSRRLSKKQLIEILHKISD